MKTKLYQCRICHLKYKENKWAKKCQAWCEKYQSCNLEITKHALRKGGEDERKENKKIP